MPDVPASACLRWVRTREVLHAQARALGLRHRYYYLEPPGASRSASWCSAARPARFPSAARCGSAPRGRCLSARCGPATCSWSSSTDRLARSVSGFEPDRRLARRGRARRGAARLAHRAHASISASSSGDRASAPAPATCRPSDAAAVCPPAAVALKFSPSTRRRQHHRHHRLSHEHDRRDLDCGSGLQRAHLAEHAHPEAAAVADAQADRRQQVPAAEVVGGELGRHAAPGRTRGPRRPSSAPGGDGRTCAAGTAAGRDAQSRRARA